MSFLTDYVNSYETIMTAATGTGSPFDQTIEFVKDEVNNFNLSEREKAEIIAGYMAQITTNITTGAMQSALAITDKLGKYADEAANVAKQGQVLTEQINKLKADTSYVETQEAKLIEQVEHNKVIKAMDSMGDMIGTVGAGGLKPTASMWTTYYSLNQSLTGLSLPASPDLTPAS